MIIEDNRPVIEVNFKDLKAGDIFSYSDIYYIKVEECYEEGTDAVCLTDGEITEFYPNDEVIKLNAKLVIE